MMRINARLDEADSQKLAFLRQTTHLHLSDILRRSIDLYYHQVKQSPTAADLACEDKEPSKVWDQDRQLLRDIASALDTHSDDHEETRQRLRRALAAQSASGLKALLAAAPLENIELDRSRDTGRDLDL